MCHAHRDWTLSQGITGYNGNQNSADTHSLELVASGYGSGHLVFVGVAPVWACFALEHFVILNSLSRLNNAMNHSSEKSSFLNYLSIAAVSALPSFSLLFFGPLQQYYYNIFEFAFPPAEALIVCFAISLACTVVVTALLTLLARSGLPQVFFIKAFSIVFAVGVMLWLQGNVLLWEYGLLDGREVNWREMRPQGVVDLSLWIIVVGVKKQ